MCPVDLISCIACVCGWSLLVVRDQKPPAPRLNLYPFSFFPPQGVVGHPHRRRDSLLQLVGHTALKTQAHIAHYCKFRLPIHGGLLGTA